MSDIDGTLNTWMDYFSHKELACQCGCGTFKMDQGFMREIGTLRTHLGFPFVVSSAVRCPAHNDRVSSTGFDGPHTTGRAIDILVNGYQAYDLVRQGMIRGMSVGVNQRGPRNARFIHLDLIERERPIMWTY